MSAYLKSLDDFLLQGRANGKRVATGTVLIGATTMSNTFSLTGLPFSPSIVILTLKGNSMLAGYTNYYAMIVQCIKNGELHNGGVIGEGLYICRHNNGNDTGESCILKVTWNKDGIYLEKSPNEGQYNNFYIGGRDGSATGDKIPFDGINFIAIE